MSQCLPSGWGEGAWGTDPWGGEDAVFGGPLPTTENFDLYCFGPCGPMAALHNYVEVSVVETGVQFSFDSLSIDLKIESGGLSSTEGALLTLTTAVPDTFTFEWTAFFSALPPSFNALSESHIYFGVTDAAGPVVGLFFSRAGIAYSGSVHFEAATLVLDGPFHILPGSAGLVTEGEYFTFRVAVSLSLGTVNLYVTKTVDLHSIGHQLRFMLPVLSASAMAEAPSDQTLISVRGTAGSASTVFIDTICLGSGLLIPNIVPFADAGPDQALQRCTVLELDGTRSFDPEGAPLTYRWRLIGAPETSQYAFQALDGATYPQLVPNGFTDRFYSPSISYLHAQDPIVSGDVITLGGEVYVVASVGTDDLGFFVRVQGYILPDTLAAAGFGFFRQRGLSGRAQSKPTFYPDAPGIYRFDLVVFDGNLFSPPSTTVVNVTESAIARGITPDLSFLWNYLSDFWRLVEDRERIEVFWSGMAQILSAQLLTLWQIDYSKSLRDIERTLQRRWLHYDLLMQESLPEQTSVRAVFSGLESGDITVEGWHVTGRHLDLELPSGLVVIPFSGNYPDDISLSLRTALASVDPRIEVRLIPKRHGDPLTRVRIDAPFAIRVAATSTTNLFLPGQTNGLLSGSGSVLGTRSYKVDRSLSGLGIVEGDFLVLGQVAYRIARVIDSPADQWPFQRVSLLDEVPVTASASFAISSKLTSKTLDFDKALVTAGDLLTFHVISADDSVTPVRLLALGTSEVTPSSLAFDATALGLALLDRTALVVLVSVLRRTYLPLDPLVVDIPYLQEKIKATDDTEVLRRNVDFFLEQRNGAPCLRFVTGAIDVWGQTDPPHRMWAETTYLDNRPTIEANFGIPAGFTLDNLEALSTHVDYLSSVKGLWFAYFNGPTLFNLKAGTQILLGLPFAQEAGTIEEIRTDFSSSHSRILVRDAGQRVIVRSYTYPAALPLETNPETGAPYKIGDTVAQFAPLVAGVDVIDWVKDPTWFGQYLEQGVFTEVEKYRRFLIRVNSIAFNLQALLFVQSFIGRIKPTEAEPMFVVLARIGDTEVSVIDGVSYRAILRLNDLGVTDGALGMATMVDEGRPAGGGWRSRFDAGPDPAIDPTYPDADLVLWGADKNYLSPEDAITAKGLMPMPHLDPPYFTSGTPSFLPFLDGIFRSDLPLFEVSSPGSVVFVDNHVFGIAALGYVMKPDPAEAGLTGLLNHCLLELTGDPGAEDPNYELALELGGVEVVSLPFVLVAPGALLGFDVALDVLPSSLLRARIRPVGGGVRRPYLHQMTVTLSQKVGWALDTPLPAGTYGAVFSL